jgi:thiamine pyrophosphokinase
VTAPRDEGRPATTRRGGELRAALFLNGEYAADDAFYRRIAGTADLLVAADGGAARLTALGLRPDAVVGDLDSLDAASLAALRAAGVRVVVHPVCKDETDAELAAAWAVAAGAGRLVVCGALGAGFDHALGNVALLRRQAAAGVDARLAAPDLTVVVLLAGQGMRLSAQPGTRFSLVPLTRRAVASLDGFEYDLDRAALRADRCRGLGNSVRRRGARVRLHAGAAAVLVVAAEEAAVTADAE